MEKRVRNANTSVKSVGGLGEGRKTTQGNFAHSWKEKNQHQNRFRKTSLGGQKGTMD